MPARPFRLILAAALALSATAAPAQNKSEGYKFLDAVRKEDITEIQTMLNKAGSVVINTRAVSDGETPLHAIVKNNTERSVDFLSYLLSRGANPNVRDDAGTAPIVLAATRKRDDMVRKFVTYKANVNFSSSNGETALIVAVRQRNTALIALLLDAGANPDQRDLLQGMSARDYAAQDARSPAILKMIEAAPKQVRRAVSGPKL